MKDYGTCFLDYGQVYNPSNTNVGPIATPEPIHLGQVYWVFVAGKARRIRIVKNVTGSALSACQVVKYVTTAGRFMKDVTVCTTANDPVAGCVEDGYKGGVANNQWFRMVEYAEDHQLILQTTTGSDTTLTNGGILVASDDDGMVHKQTVDAAGVLAGMGRAKVATTSGTENGLKFNASICVPFAGI